METWAIVTLVLGAGAISALSALFVTKKQIKHSDRRFERELERAREADYHQRRWEVRGEILLKLRAELVLMATKQDKLVASAHKLHTRFGMTEEEAKEQLQENVDDINAYLASGDFQQTFYLQSDVELLRLVEQVRLDYLSLYDYAREDKPLSADELKESRKLFEKIKNEIPEVQELINKRLEEL